MHIMSKNNISCPGKCGFNRESHHARFVSHLKTCQYFLTCIKIEYDGQILYQCPFATRCTNIFKTVTEVLNCYVAHICNRQSFSKDAGVYSRQENGQDIDEDNAHSILLKKRNIKKNIILRIYTLFLLCSILQVRLG